MKDQSENSKASEKWPSPKAIVNKVTSNGLVEILFTNEMSVIEIGRRLRTEVAESFMKVEVNAGEE